MRRTSLRRLGVALLAVAAGSCLFTPAWASAAADQGAAGRLTPAAQAASVSRAYQFLDQMMDRYAKGAVPRLVQSYSGGVLGAEDYTVSSTYDDALVIDAYLAEHTGAGLSRAQAIGRGLLTALAQGGPDGGLYDDYTPAPLEAPADAQAATASETTGNVAWAGDALLQLYAATRIRSYLTGAESLAGWIQANTADSRGAGGYTGGYTGPGAGLEWKSTEQNIDVYAFFSLLAQQSGVTVWATRAASARNFIASMWNPAAGRFDLGTGTDGITANDATQAEDVNSWSYLALQSPAYAASVGWDVQNLATTAGPFSGVSICPGDRTGVWFEGTAHLADALELRGQPGDLPQAAAYLSDIGYAQAHGPNEDGLGIMAASENGLSDCEGGAVYASLHTGTTAWYILAASGINPLSTTVPISVQ